LTERQIKTLRIFYTPKLGTCESFFFRSNRIFESNRPVQSDNSCLHFTLTANI